MNVLLLLLLALTPVAAIIWYVYARDKYEKEPTRLLLACFMLGVVSVIPAVLGSQLGVSVGIDESPNIFMTFLFAFLVVALSEEGSKYLFLRYYIFPKKDFNEPYDGIIYAVMISMGFAAFENVLYVLQGGWQVALLRMFTAVPAHATFGVFMGYYAGLAKMTTNPQQRQQLLLKGLLLAVALHGAYDFFLFQQNIEGLTLVSFVGLILGIRYARRTIAILQNVSPFSDPNIVDHAQAQQINDQVPTIYPIQNDQYNDNNNNGDDQQCIELEPQPEPEAQLLLPMLHNDQPHNDNSSDSNSNTDYSDLFDTSDS